jgi:Uncharacterized conserved protein
MDPVTESATHFTLWGVFCRPAKFDDSTLSFEQALHHLPDGVALRGVYDVSGLRADADVLFWLTGPSLAALQTGYRRLRDTSELTKARAVWSAAGVHRDAEFNPDHLPAFAKGLPPREWVAVYPFVRSPEWYLLPGDERRALLREHGQAGAGFPQVQTNTVAAFALGDYEWILALEADDPVDLVDLVRDLRSTGARRHVREETPFFTGRRIEPRDVGRVIWS